MSLTYSLSVDNLVFTYKKHIWRLEEWIKESKDEKMKEMYEIEYRVYSKIVKDFEGLKQ
jgi:hypothetical protein